MVSIWYQVLRYIAVIGLLSILIYLGIKIILSSSAGKKAEYKSALINWVIAMFLIIYNALYNGIYNSFNSKIHYFTW